MDLSSFYIDSNLFERYSTEHFVSVGLMALFGIWFLRRGKYAWTEESKWRNALIFACFIYFTQLFKVAIKIWLGTFNPMIDLPLELCNMLPLFMILSLWYRSRWGLSIIFFWILAGTSQSNITPTLTNVFPHYEAIRYWVIHMGLPILALYTVYVLKFHFTILDAIRSGIGLNVMAAIIYPINIALGSNYMYLMSKPPGPTLYDALGPWPWYILSLEFLLVVLFSLVLVPFYYYKKYRVGEVK